MNEAEQDVHKGQPRKPILVVAGDLSGQVCLELSRHFAEVVALAEDGAAVQLARANELRELQQLNGLDALAMRMADVVEGPTHQGNVQPHDWYRRFAGRYGGRPPYF